jgi:hypothetical protein
MREGPLAELFKATEAAQRQAERERDDAATLDQPTVEHVGPDVEDVVERNTKAATDPEAAAPPAPDPLLRRRSPIQDGTCAGPLDPTRPPTSRSSASSASEAAA